MPPVTNKAGVDQIDLAPPPSRKGGLLRIIALLGGALAFSAAGFGASWYLNAQKPSAMEDALRLIERDSTKTDEKTQDGPQKVPLATPEAESFVTTYHALTEPLTTNLAGSRHFLQVGVTLSTQYDAKVIENVTKHEAALRSDMLAVLGSLTETDISGTDGRANLASALREAVNARLMALEGFGGIEGVYFTSFVLQ